MKKKKMVGVKITGGERTKVTNNTFQDLDIGIDIKGGKNHHLSKNKMFKSKSKSEKRMIWVELVLGIAIIIIGRLILYYGFGI